MHIFKLAFIVLLIEEILSSLYMYYICLKNRIISIHIYISSCGKGYPLMSETPCGLLISVAKSNLGADP